MLCQFTFSNYKSFKGEAFLDLFAESISEHKESLITDKDGQRFLPVISIYGPNGGGKSTVLDALDYLGRFVNVPIFMMQAGKVGSADEVWEDEPPYQAVPPRKDIYFKFCEECAEEPTEFEVLYRNLGYEFKYELSLIHGNIIRENLYGREIGRRNARVVFERSDDGIEVGNELKGLPLDKVRGSFPLISYISAAYDIEIVNKAAGWFRYATVMNYDEPGKDHMALIPKGEAIQKRMMAMLQEMDINISGMRVEYDENGRIREVFTRHSVGGKEHELRLEDESSGTRKLFSCLARINQYLEVGRLLLADELDAKLHPKILRYIIEGFTDPSINKNGAQLILTSHDMVNMNPDVFRRDEIWFCSQDYDNSSNLYSLVSFSDERGRKVRKDEIYSKRYLEGHYGADPYIARGLDWEVDG